jgi:MYXO-CTERM domain-containing protein
MVRGRQSLVHLGCLLLALTPAACEDNVVDVRSARLSTDAGPGCMAVPSAGCCNGYTLYYCSGAKLLAKTCKAGETCGWNVTFGMYVCGTSVLPKDPTGAHPRECTGDLGAPPDLSPPADAQVTEGGAGCGPLGFAGCCTAQGTLHYCVGSQVMSLDCSKQPACGWNPQGEFYTCGTGGKSDPSGQHPKSCASVVGDSGLQLDAIQIQDLGHDSAPIADLTADLPSEAGADAFEPTDAGPEDTSADGIAEGGTEGPVGLDASGLDVSSADGGSLKASGGGGCGGCAVAGREPPPAPAPLLLLLLLFFVIIMPLRRRP